jgi:hypothetical protein
VSNLYLPQHHHKRKHPVAVMAEKPEIPIDIIPGYLKRLYIDARRSDDPHPFESIQLFDFGLLTDYSGSGPSSSTYTMTDPILQRVDIGEEHKMRQFDQKATKRLLRKMDWHLMPLLSFLYL